MRADHAAQRDPVGLWIYSKNTAGSRHVPSSATVRIRGIPRIADGAWDIETGTSAWQLSSSGEGRYTTSHSKTDAAKNRKDVLTVGGGG